MKNGIVNFLHTFVIVAVFACISCSHQRNISDGGLSTNALEGTEEKISTEAPASEENSGDQAVLETNPDLEAGVVASNEPTADASGDTALIVPEDGSKESDILVATNDTPVQLIPPSENAEGSTETMSEATPSAAEIAAAVSEQTGTEEQVTPAPAPIEKKKRAFKKRTPATKSKNEPTQVHSEPVQQPAAQAPARPVQDPFRGGEDDEEVRPEAQQAGAGIAGFIEQHAFWVASAIVGFILCLFFFAKRKKATDDGFNL